MTATPDTPPPAEPCPHPPEARRTGSHDQIPYCGLCNADLPDKPPVLDLGFPERPEESP